jgi:hypothetical protein
MADFRFTAFVAVCCLTAVACERSPEAAATAANGRGIDEQATYVEVVDAIREAGGKVIRADSDPGRPVIEVWWWTHSGYSIGNTDLAKLKKFPELRKLTLIGSSHYDGEGFAHIGELSSLRELDVHHVPTLENEDLVHLEQLKQLERLKLDQVWLTAEGLQHVRVLKNLKSLEVASDRVTDKAMPHIGQLTNLRELDLMYTNISDAGLTHLDGLSKLERLL